MGEGGFERSEKPGEGSFSLSGSQPLTRLAPQATLSRKGRGFAHGHRVYPLSTSDPSFSAAARALARGIDPNDGVLLAEIRAIPQTAGWLVRLVAELTGAADCARRGTPVRVADPVAGPGDLLAAVVGVLGPDHPPVVAAAEADPALARLLRWIPPRRYLPACGEAKL